MAPTVLDGCDLDAPVAQEEVFGPLVTLHRFRTDDEAIAAANRTRYGLAASVWTENVSRAHAIASALEAGTIWVNCWLHRELHMPFGGYKASGVAREGGEESLNFYSETSTVCLKLGDRKPPPMPGLPVTLSDATATAAAPSAASPLAAAVSLAVTGSSGSIPLATTVAMANGAGAMGGAMGIARRYGTASAALSTVAAAPDAGHVASAPKPMGTYTHARRVGELLFLAGIGPRDPATDQVPGGSIESADGSKQEYDAAAQTRACIANVRRVLNAHGADLSAVVDVQCYLVDMKRDFAAFNVEYAAAFGGLAAPPTRTTVEVAELPPGGRIAVELKVVAQCPP